MASGTRQITGVGAAVFDFTATRRGTLTFFSNDLNIDFRLTMSAPGTFLQIHAGPILFAVSANVAQGFRVQLIPLSIGSGFPPPPLSLVQLQTDTVLQVPSELAAIASTETDPWEQS